MDCILKPHSDFGLTRVEGEKLCFTAGRTVAEGFFAMTLELPHWEKDTYVFLPACAYRGNMFRQHKGFDYPPQYTPEELASGEMVIPEVPALNPDGSGVIDVTSGDMSVPCVGIYHPEAGEGMLLFTPQAVKGKNLGFRVSRGRVEISCPAHREYAYRWSKGWEPDPDTGIALTEGEEITLPFRRMTFSCRTLDGFFEMFFHSRRCLLSGERAPFGYTDGFWKVMENHFNEHLWSGEYYGSVFHAWQPGWCGPGMNTDALLRLGTPETRRRAVRTLDYMVAHQSPVGLFYCTNDGKNDTGTYLIRRAGDILNCLVRQLSLPEAKPAWSQAALRCAQGLRDIWLRHGTFGQYVDSETGDMIYPAGCGGASCVSGLVRAAEYFERPDFLDTAQAAGELYYREFVARGFTGGAVGDAICAPDSESSFALCEGFWLLYRATGNEVWLDRTKAAVHLSASWVVPYRYTFPQGSEFYRLNINTVGTVFANVQNKHSAPGICTGSAACLYDLWKATGEEAYLELLLDIVSALPQCVSTEERPIIARMSPWGGVQLEEPVVLPAGYVSERVNMSDWEGFYAIGNVFNASCWCESSVIMTFADLIKDKELTW